MEGRAQCCAEPICTALDLLQLTLIQHDLRHYSMPHTTRKGGTKRHKASTQPISDHHYSAPAAASVSASHSALPGPSRFAPSAAYVATRNPAPPVSGYGYQPPPGYPAPPPSIAARLSPAATSASNWYHQPPAGYPPYPPHPSMHAVSGSGSYYPGSVVAPPAPLPLVHPPPDPIPSTAPHFSYGERRSFSRTPSIGTSRDASPARYPHEGRASPAPAPAPASTSAPPHTVVDPNPVPKRPIPPPPPAPYHAPPLSPAPAISAPPPATPATAQADFIAFPASTPAVPVTTVEESSSSDSSSTSSSSSSDDDGDSSSDEASLHVHSEHNDDGDDDEEEDSDEEAVADALVGARRNSSAHLRDHDRDLADRSMAPPPPSSLFGGSVSDSSSDSDSSNDDDEEVEHVSDIEEAVLEQVGDEDDVGADETLPFDFESASEDSDDSQAEGTAGEEAEGTAGDESLEPIRPRASNRKRQRVDSVGSDLTAEFEVDSRSTSRAGSSEPVHTLATGPSDESMFIARAIAPALSPPARSPSPVFLSTSTPARTRVAEPLPDVPDIPLAPESEDLEEGEEPEEGELVDPPPPRDITLPDEISAALSALRAAATGAFVPNDHLRQPVVVAAPSGPPVPKASYERKKRVSLGASEATPPAAPATKRVKLSYKPSPLSKPSSDAVATTAATTSTAATVPPARAVYVRRSERSEGGTPTPENGPAQAPAPVKAVYQRRADALVAMSSTTASNGKKNGKLRGALPLSREEKAERLPPKFYAAFGEFPTPDAAKVSTIYGTPKHTVLPARNLAPPNEAALHGFWPGPPSRKQASSKAIFPAPLVPLHDDDDDRPRVEVFIDNSNVLYSFLNWVRARSDAKVTSLKASGKDGAKSVKTVTVGGKKVKLDYRCLFAVLERGRKVERRVIVGSSTLWQSLEPAVEWGYEISLLQRVPRAENSKMSAANISAAANQLAAANGNKKRKGKAEIVVQQPVQGPSQIKHYKEQAVDELVHLKILQSLLDFDPPPLPMPSREPTPEPAVPAPVEPVVEPAVPAPDGEVPAPAAKPRFQPSAAFLSGPDTAPQPLQPADSAATAPKPVPRFLPAGSKPPPPPKNPSIVRIVPRTRPRNRPVLVIGTGDANSSEYNPGGFLGCVRRALDRGWDVEIAAFTSGISSLWTGERMRRFTEDGRPRGELRVIDLALFGEELVTV
ncbi:hypothetical protein JCM10908_006935 [Rhodotorula pacifica]|uniref:uncharacterized protein n=1 Tax=Rhodotorula pacifica TaxID=1495444 RepID=UPI00316B8D5F